jgi:hypothetical protein
VLEEPDILKRCEGLGYKTFLLDDDVNIVAVRSPAPLDANEFNDTMHVLYRRGPEWKTSSWPITCDPGRSHLEHPLNKDGCARLRAGQYLKSHKIGLHRGQYRALVQCRPVTVDRYKDGERVGSFTGMFGINIHRASAGVTTEFVNRWSAGCLVFQNAVDFEEFMQIVTASMTIYGPYVSLTLLED